MERLEESIRAFDVRHMAAVVDRIQGPAEARAGLLGDPEAHDRVVPAPAFFDALAPHQTGAYVNFLDRDDDEARVRSAYGDEKYRRLAPLKHRYDPDNVFRLNHNIRPSA